MPQQQPAQQQPAQQQPAQQQPAQQQPAQQQPAQQQPAQQQPAGQTPPPQVPAGYTGLTRGAQPQYAVPQGSPANTPATITEATYTAGADHFRNNRAYTMANPNGPGTGQQPHIDAATKFMTTFDALKPEQKIKVGKVWSDVTTGAVNISGAVNANVLGRTGIGAGLTNANPFLVVGGSVAIGAIIGGLVTTWLGKQQQRKAEQQANPEQGGSQTR